MTAAPVPMLKSSKSFASKSLGERDKTGAQVTLYRVRYKVKDTSSFNWRKPFSPLKDRYLIGHPEPVTGTLDPGMMFALMGSSGSGKSTLMDVIARRKTMGTIGGLILFDGHVPSKAEVIRDTGYVEQYDTLWEFFTVHEMLMYTARLKMSPKFTLQQKRDRVDEVIEHLGLGKARNTKIGGPMVRGVSGGEAKRISIGIGLLNNPRIMFFDEPRPKPARPRATTRPRAAGWPIVPKRRSDTCGDPPPPLPDAHHLATSNPHPLSCGSC